jgi:hypothetical protein
MYGRSRKYLITGGAALLACTVASQARAVTSCDDPTLGLTNPIYLTGSSAFVNTAGFFALKLAAASTPASILYTTGTASCDGALTMETGAALSGTATYFVPTTVANNPLPFDKPTCAIPAGQHTDLAVSDIFWESCPNVLQPRPHGIKDIPGPVQAMLFIVPEGNTTQTSLSAEQAQIIWGCPSGGTQWGFTSVHRRDQNSGTQGIVATAIGVSTAAILGISETSSGNMIANVAGVADPMTGIGFVAADSYDGSRNTVNALAFRAFRQTLAYYADSDASKHDRRNVRDGHYTVWGPEHFLVAIDANGNITNQKAADLISWINGSVAVPAPTGSTANPDLYIALEAQAGIIPACAMKVKRSSDGGLMSPLVQDDRCGCFFESNTVDGITNTADCVSCANDGQCSGGKKCLHHYCE